MNYPSRAFVQTFDCVVPPDYCGLVDELTANGVNVTLSNEFPTAISHQTLVVGDFTWTKHAIHSLHLSMPIPPDYPACLKHLLYRRIGQSTLGDMRARLLNSNNDNIFMKPALDTKAFSAIIEPKDQMLDCLIDGIPGVMAGLPLSTAVHWAEVVDMLSEFRVYVVNAEIRSVCCYKTFKPEISEDRTQDEDGTSAANILDMAVVRDAVKTYAGSDEGKDVICGCGMDFAVMRRPGGFVTALIEVNDGYSLGKYPECSAKDYTDLLISRWESLMRPGPTAG